MKKYIFLALILALPFYSSAQINKNGSPFIDHYSDEDYGNVGQVWSIVQDAKGMMYFGCNFGLKTYDGKRWEGYGLPYSTIIRSLTVDNDGIVYYGSEGDFGAIIADEKGDLKFYSIFVNKFKDQDPDFGSIWKTSIADNKVYFQSFEKMFWFNLPLKIDENDSLLNKVHWIPPENTQFHLSFPVNENLYIREWEKGLCVMKDGVPELIPGGEQFALARVYIMLPLDDSKILIGTRQMGFFVYDTTKEIDALSTFEIADSELIMNSSLYSGTILPNGNIAISTFNSGIIIINKSGEIVKQLDKEAGLPDNFILSMYNNTKNNEQDIWFTSDAGIFKANVLGPFTKWDNTLGISGVVQSAVVFNDILYVSTKEGLFYLDKTNGKRPKFKLLQQEIDCWKLFIYNVPDSDEKKLMMGSFRGVFELMGNKLELIVENQNTFELYQSKRNPENLYVGSGNGLSILKFENNSWTQYNREKGDIRRVRSIAEFDKYILVAGTNTGIFMMEDLNSDYLIKIDSTKGFSMLGQDYYFHEINGKTVLASGSGLFEIKDTVKVERFDYFGEIYSDSIKGVFTVVKDIGAYWLSVYEVDIYNPRFQLIKFTGDKKFERDSAFSKIIPQKPTYLLFVEGNNLWIGNEKGLYTFDKEVKKDYKKPFKTLITKVKTLNDSLVFAGKTFSFANGYFSLTDEQNSEMIPILNYSNNTIIFEWAAAFYENEKETEFSYRLVGESDEWSKWGSKSDIRYTNLYEGDYTFEVKAKNIYFTESSVAKFNFTILPPWYRTVWAYISYLIIAVFLVYIIIKLYTKKLIRENEKLEQTVKERTAEIRMQKEEIEAQRDEIQLQKEQVEKSKDKIEKQQKSIMDSIHYASRIQEAVLPPDEFLQEILGEHFVLFKPRDIVSGDFYWATQRGNKTVIVAADCTGHGVPGAFMSMLGISFLNEIVNKEEILQANIILNRLRQNVKRSLRQTGKENEAKDGMDIAICIIDLDEMELQFAGAYNPLYLLRNGEISRVKADRMPIGIYLREKDSFTNNIVEIKKGDYLYIFSDGYVDQFGGPTDDKIKSEKFKSLLLENHKKSPEEQKTQLVKFLDEWMAYKDKTGRTYKQVDDILVIGIEI